MQIIDARNVNDAFVLGVNALRKTGLLEDSRAGQVLVYPTPMTTIYRRPTQRVLFHERRDANPFFHLMEALWMLAGRNDATWLDRFVADFSSRFAEEDGRIHGAYGYRWRKHFDIDWEGHPFLPDQLTSAVNILKADPTSRQVVITMWDPVADLGAKVKDKPCNTHVYLRVRGDQGMMQIGEAAYSDYDDRVLDLTVCCRSNDIIWGAYGANAVHFSILHEYLAARIGVQVGTYYQISNNYHAYIDVLDKLTAESEPLTGDVYEKLRVIPLVNDPESFDDELQWFFQATTVTPHEPKCQIKNLFLSEVAVPMFFAYQHWRAKETAQARDQLLRMPSCDWKVAAQQFFQRRLDRRVAKENA